MRAFRDARAARFVIAAVVWAGATLNAHAALGPNEAVEYVYLGNDLDYATISNHEGTFSGPTVRDGIDFSFIVPDYIQPGTNVQFEDRISSFEGVMGDAGAFTSWSFSWCFDIGCFSSSESRDLETLQYAWFSNVGKPGIWQVNIVSKPYSSEFYGHPTPIGFPSVVPEPGVTWMALIGLAAVGSLTRRKAQAQAKTA